MPNGSTRLLSIGTDLLHGLARQAIIASVKRLDARGASQKYLDDELTRLSKDRQALSSDESGLQ